ncbi:DNA polymerase III subunit epsilon [compost metagenome]
MCKRYGIDNSGRELHGALLDSELLADVYLSMTGGQTSLSLAGQGADGEENGEDSRGSEIRRLIGRQPGRIIPATEQELEAHLARLEAIAKSAGGPALWQQLSEAN